MIQVPHAEQLSVIETMQAGIATVDEVGAAGKRRLFALARLGLLVFVLAELLAMSGVAALVWVQTGTPPGLESGLLVAGVASPIASLIAVAVVIVGLLDVVASMPMEVARTMAKLRRALPPSPARVAGDATRPEDVYGAYDPLALDRLPTYGNYGNHETTFGDATRDMNGGGRRAPRAEPRYDPWHNPRRESRFDHGRDPSSPYALPPLPPSFRFTQAEPWRGGPTKRRIV
jgi:hypothetical protein